MTRHHRRKLAGVAAAVAGVSFGLGPLAIMSAAAATTSGAAAAAGTGSAAGAAAASSACTAPGYVHCRRYSFTGNDQWFTAPAGVSDIKVLEWGAGGGGASSPAGQYTGGSGGYTVGQVAVHPGQVLTVTVGQGGFAAGTGYDVYGYGGGGLGGNGTTVGAGGGGMSALWNGVYSVSPLLIAGGGGGASPNSAHGTDGNYTATIGGGAGGGLYGGSDGSGYSGSGGAQTYAGIAGAPPVACLGSGGGGTAPGDGQQYQGGPGGGSDPSPPGLGAVANGGGGGGGGYWGGGGGRCQVRNTDFPNGAGGGGSGFIAGGGVSNAWTVQGVTATHAGLNKGAPPNTLAGPGNPLYLPGLSWGGGTSGAANGGNGQVVIEWGKKTPPPPPTPTPTPTRTSPPVPPGPPTPPGPPMPVTGFPFEQFGAAGLALVMAGSAAAWAARRPRRRS
jgi:hypothetical protein